MLRAAEFLALCDGFSIGSNDLTQLTMGIDRDSGTVEGFDERDASVKMLMVGAISACKAAGKYVGLCGQGPSDHPELAAWLTEQARWWWWWLFSMPSPQPSQGCFVSTALTRRVFAGHRLDQRQRGRGAEGAPAAGGG